MKPSELTGAKLSKAEKCRIARTTHGMHKARTYNIWQKMKVRCTDPKSDNWEWYGGIDGSKGYEPGNCRWASLNAGWTHERALTEGLHHEKSL